MKSRKRKSRISLRNLLRNKKTLAVALFAMAAVTGLVVYRQVSKPDTNAKADCKVVRGVINDLSDIEGKTCNKSTRGTKKDNPFLILEVVPYAGYGEFGYQIEGLSPVKIDDNTGKYCRGFLTGGGEGSSEGQNYRAATYMLHAFEDEEFPGSAYLGTVYPDRPSFKQDLTKLDAWSEKSGELTLYGYYEFVGEGNGFFSYNENYVDDDFVNGKSVYRPKFTYEGPNKGSFVWVSMFKSATDKKFVEYVENENKYLDTQKYEADDLISYKIGQREYTSRTENTYYQSPSSGDNPTNAKIIYFNDFVRTSINVKKADNAYVVIKTIEPTELNSEEGKKWIDYADLVYVYNKPTNKDNCLTAWKETDKRKIKKSAVDWDVSGIGSADFAAKYDFGYCSSGTTWYDNHEQNDLRWDRAYGIFCKTNLVGEYAKSSGCALLLDGAMLGNNLGDIEKASVSNSEGKYLNYTDMVASDTNWEQGSTGYDNNVYKLSLMTFLMDQTSFYNLFCAAENADGLTAITSKDGGKTAVCQIQPTEKAQKYWCANTFLPDNWREIVSKKPYKYGLTYTGQTWFYVNSNYFGVTGNTYWYTGQCTLSQELGNTSTNSMHDEKLIYDWYADPEQNDPHSRLNMSDVIFYLLSPHKSGDSNDFNDGKLNILDIEPCSDFTTFTDTRLAAMFPTISKEDIVVEYMTTNEFNSKNLNLAADYDIIYIGDAMAKMNTNDGSAVYNNSSIAGKGYVHVGDAVSPESGSSQMHASGNDLTAPKVNELKNYLAAGNYMILSNKLYSRPADYTVKSSNIYDFLTHKAVKNKKLKNLFSLTLVENTSGINFSLRHASVKITDTPAKYDGTTDSKLSSNKLTFKFSLGFSANKDEKYAIRFKVDTNGDGKISENEDGATDVTSWDVDGNTGRTYEPSRTYGEVAEYEVSYQIPNDRGNGAVAWQFIVYSVSNPDVYYEVSGVSLYQNKKNEGNIIRVLQVVSNDATKSTGDLSSTKADDPYANSYTNWFNSYGKTLDDYKFEVTTIPLGDNSAVSSDDYDVKKTGYLNAFRYVSDQAGLSEENTTGEEEGVSSSNGVWGNFQVASETKAYYYPQEYLTDYDVFLFSCGKDLECNSDTSINNNQFGAVSFAAWLADEGKSVVFTKDSVYDHNVSGRQNAMKLLKDALGLSRYTSADVTNSKYNDFISNNKETYDAEKINEYTYSRIARNAASGNTYKIFNNDKWKILNGDKVTYPTKKQTTKKASQTNVGTVCVYPYVIPENLELTGTCGADFQLNLNNPMTNVWYSLGKYTDNADKKRGDSNSFYEISPNDGANNYYLYSTNNVYYMGIDLAEVSSNDEEKLFINTLIQAYEAQYSEPYVTVNKVYNREQKKNEELSVSMPEGGNYKYDYTASLTLDPDVIKTIRYRDYLEQTKRGSNVVHSIVEKKTSQTPPEEEEEEDPDDPDDPSEEPEIAEPYTVYTAPAGLQEPFNQTTYSCTDATFLNSLSDEAVIQISYYTTEAREADEVIFRLFGMQYNYDIYSKPYVSVTASSGSKASTELQTFNISVGDLKDACNCSNLSIIQLAPYPNEWNGWYVTNRSLVQIQSIMVYPDARAIVSDEEEEVTLESAEVEVKSKDIFKDTDSHMIYFTPKDNGMVSGDAFKSVTLGFVDDDGVTLPGGVVSKIYRKAANGKYYMVESENGVFSIDNKMFLKNGTQYFIVYDKNDANMEGKTVVFNTLSFTIKNDKNKTSKTRLYFTTESQDPDNQDEDVYMFDLD